MDGHYPALTLIEVNGASQAITQCGGRESADRGCASELMLLSSSKKMKEECTTFFRDCVAATMKVGIQWCWRRQKQTKPSRDSLAQASCTVGWKPGVFWFVYLCICL